MENAYQSRRGLTALFILLSCTITYAEITFPEATYESQSAGLLSLNDTQEGFEPEQCGMAWVKDPLLPKTVVPNRYDLFLNPNLTEGTFEGNVLISVTLSEPRKCIYLHSYKLLISSTQVLDGNDVSINVSKSFEYEPNQFWVIELAQEIGPGQYKIKLEFKGNLSGKIIGFYRSEYKASDGGKRFIATTKFEPTYARQAFPCFDEPIFKANFLIKIVHPSKDYFALSNMNVVNELADSPVSGFTTSEFAMTPPMATYLACFIVSDFHHLETKKTSSGLPVTVYASTSQINNMKFARDLAVKAMNYFVDYFGIEFPLPKLDLIAIPDFVSGAMENWGLVTFRESSVIINEDSSSTNNYENVAITVSHELAHMWFGDLVTMKWWDDLWLNEGFATFQSINCVKEVLPDWNVGGNEVVRNRVDVMVEDSALSSHPIIQNVTHPDQITEMFDAISYKKGSLVLRMLGNMGPEKFRIGVKNYLKKFEYGNARTVDLWESVQGTFDNVDIKRVMGTWTEQMGYPLITVIRKNENLIMSQQRFLADKDLTFLPDTSPFGYKWDVPISIITSVNPKVAENVFLHIENETITVSLPPEATWFKLNANQFGFYRVNYEEAQWKTLSELLKIDHNALAPGDRANLIDDAFSLAKAGYIIYDIPLSLLTYISHSPEDSHETLVLIANHLNTLKTYLYSTTTYSLFKKYIQELLKPSVKDDLWDVNDSDDFQTRGVKGAILSLACNYEIPSAFKKASELFTKWINGNIEKLHPQIKALVYKYGINGEHEVENWNKLWVMYLNEQNPQERGKYSSGLASVQNPELLRRLIVMIQDESNVRSQDYFTFLRAIAVNPVGTPLVWQFIKENWPSLVERFTLNDRYLGRLIPAVTSSFSTTSQLEEVTNFFKTFPDAGAGASGRKLAVETIKNNINWHTKHLAVIDAWLQKYHHKQ